MSSNCYHIKMEVFGCSVSSNGEIDFELNTDGEFSIKEEITPTEYEMSDNHDRRRDFHKILYNDEGVYSNDEEGSVIELSSDTESELDEPEAPPYSPLTSPERSPVRQMEEHYSRAQSPDRSRSPLGLSSESASAVTPGAEQGNIVLQIFNENGVPLEEAVREEEFSAPDAHLLSVSPEERERERDRVVRNRDRASGRRGDKRSVKGVRGQSARGRPDPGHDFRKVWQIGHPLLEICLSDADVPSELLVLATDVLMKRQKKQRIADRVARENTERERASESENEDEFLDADVGGDSLPGLDTVFEWSPMDSFRGQEEVFKHHRTGSVKDFNSAYDAFRSYWSDDILGLIVNETNRYASKISSTSFQSDWSPTNVHEILCLFAFWMMLGIVRMPTVASCFSVDPLLKTEVFRTIFTRKRYEMLSRAIHFINSDPDTNNSNPSAVNGRSSDRLYRLRPILDHLNSAFQANYILDKDICIDESLTLWKGRLNIKQYIRNKASKFGIKTFELCESTTGYLWSFIVYTGKHLTTDLEQSPGMLKSSAVVKKLMAPLLNKGYRLFMDNWYNSPLLARYLKRNGTDCVGTLRPSRHDVPVLINGVPLRRGECIARHSGDVMVLAWQDKKRVTMISTCHDSSIGLPTVNSRKPLRPVPFKPQVVLDYNKFMGGVDLKDQMLEPYLLERKRCSKWYMKLFKRLLNVSILNSRTLLQSSTKKHHDHLAFRLQLVDSILKNHLQHCPASRKSNISSTNSRSSYTQLSRNAPFAHWPVLLEQPEESTRKKGTYQKRCVLCLDEGRKSIKTSFRCEICDVPLCLKNCFKSYHTKSQ